MPSALDIEANRRSKPYSLGELARRMAWGALRPVFRYSPRTAFHWRSTLLRAFGAKVGRNVHVYNSASIYMPWNLTIGDWSSIGEDVLVYNLGHVTIGSKATISHRAHLCAGTHDYTRASLPLLRPPINVGDDAWVCTEAFVGPGVVIGRGAVVGARAVAVKDVESWRVVAGNPARVVKVREIVDD